MPNFITLVLQDAGAALVLIARILAFAIPFSASLLILLPAKNRAELLSKDVDGRRMFYFGLGIALIMMFGPTGLAIVVIAATTAYWIAQGGFIWMPDEWTKKLLHPLTLIVYIPAGLLAYYFGAGFGSFGFSQSANFYGLTQMLLPTVLFTLLVNLNIFTGLLTDRFKARILPQNTLGYWYMALAAALLVLAVFNINPVAMLSLTVFAMNAFVFGLLIALSEKATYFLLKDEMAAIYSFLVAVVFFGFMV